MMHNINSPRTGDDAIEAEIQAKGLTAPRVTPADIEANIVGEYYINAGQTFDGVTQGMVDRFLTWKLPQDFYPDNGISFKRESDFDHPEFGRTKYEPTGTNLFHAGQAREMLEHVVGVAPKHQALNLLTFCILVLKNGFTVTGESACASPENFDAEIGRKIARENAVQKIWPLMGYALREQLHRETLQAQPATGGLLPHQQRVVTEKAELDDKLQKLNAFMAGATFANLDPNERLRLLEQSHAMDCYSRILGERISAFTPPASEDFPLGKACDQTGATTCEACQ